MIATAVVKPLTTTGVDDFVVVPLPNWPDPLPPQHLAQPSASSAHEWLPPAVIATALVRPLTATGIDELVVAPLPNCPEALEPQHLTVPLASSAHEWLPPA